MPKATETLLEIDLNALDNNYKYLTSKLKPETKVLAVVKAFGYGSDSVVVANELVELGVAYFAVAYTGEGETLRNASIETPILVLHPLPVNFDMILKRCLEPSIYSRKMLLEFIAFAEANKQTDYPIHLKFNTGLNRLGFDENDIPFIAATLSRTKSVKVKSAFSHLAASEDLKLKDFTLGQIENFRKISERPGAIFRTMAPRTGSTRAPDGARAAGRAHRGLYKGSGPWLRRMAPAHGSGRAARSATGRAP